MAIHKMDVSAVRSIGNQMKHQASEIGQLVHAIDGQVAHALSMWHGTDADKFRDWWHNHERPAIVRMQHTVEGLGQSALNQASAQARISDH